MYKKILAELSYLQLGSYTSKSCGMKFGGVLIFAIFNLFHSSGFGEGWIF